MRTMIVREGSRGRKTTINAKKTFQRATGDWVALVDRKEFSEACAYVCEGVENCSCEKLHVQTDLDDDGKEYKVVNR